MSEQTVSAAELADELGVGRSTVQRRIASGVVPEHCLITRGRRRRVLASHRLEALMHLGGREVAGPPTSISPPRPPEANDPDEPRFNLQVERARREHYEAERAKLKYQAESRAVLPAKETRRAYTGAFRSITTRILQVPGQVASDLAAETEAHRIATVLEDHLRAALEELREAAVAGVPLLDDGPSRPSSAG